MPGDIQGIVGIMRVWSEGSRRRATVGMSLYSIMLFSVKMQDKSGCGIGWFELFQKALGHCGLPLWLSGKESTCNAGDAGTWVRFLGREDPLEEDMATHFSILA